MVIVAHASAQSSLAIVYTGGMVIIIYGTVGEYVKLLPVMRQLGNSRCISINVNMQPKQMAGLFIDTCYPRPTQSLLNGYKGKDISTIPQMIVWVNKLCIKLFGLRRLVKHWSKKEPTILIVHGDTIITPMAALFARLLYRVPVGHIEAGYRSGNWREPFPEEIDRILADKLAQVNYAVGATTIGNLQASGAKGRIVDTVSNTIVDSLQLARTSPLKPLDSGIQLPKKYVLVSIHRSEAISKESVMKELLRTLNSAASAKQPIVWLDHAPTMAKIDQFSLTYLLDHEYITRIPKLPYFQFIAVTSRALAVVTDSGGLQEESYILGIPCLIHRRANEKPSMGTLSNFDVTVLKDFMKQPEKFRQSRPKPKSSPTKIIIEDLQTHGFIQK